MPHSDPGRLGSRATFAIFVPTYIVVHDLALHVDFRGEIPTFWPAVGVAAVAVVTVAPRQRAWVAGVVFAATVIFGVVHDHHTLGPAVVYGLVNAGEVGVFLAAFTRLRVRLPVTDLGSWARFVGASLAAAAIGSNVGAVATQLMYGGGRDAAVTWFVSDAVGILVVAGPVLVSSLPTGLRPRRFALEVIGATALVAAAGWVVFSRPHGQHVTFISFATLLWPALRLGPRVTGWIVAGLGLVATVYTTAGRGPFGADGIVGLHLLQAFLATAVLTTMSLAIVVGENAAATRRALLAKARFQSSFDDALLGLLLVDVDPVARTLTCAHLNTAGRRILGAPRCPDSDSPHSEAGCGDAGGLLRNPELAAACLAVADGESSWRGEVAHHGPAGVLWLDVSVATGAVGVDELPALTVQLADVTDRMRAETELSALTQHDPLTGLANRRQLCDKLSLALVTAARQRRLVGVMFVDLDDFKNINDAHGHLVGDRVLKAVAQRLTDAVPADATVARFAGDEFVIVCPAAMGTDSVDAVVEAIEAALQAPMQVDGRRRTVTASVGVTLAGPGVSVDDALRQAAAALHVAAQHGRHQVRFFEPDMHLRALRQAQLTPELQRALTRDEFQLHFQPVIELASVRVTAVEALVRWQHPRRGLLMPNEWLDVAEQNDVIIHLGRWVLDEACRWGARWHDRLGADAPVVHVNVSTRHLSHPMFLSDVHHALFRYGFPAQKLVLELTETHLLTLSEAVRSDLAGLREEGVRVAADDYGTGYSALSHITEMDVDIIKIDKSFVMAMSTDPRCQAVVNAVVGIGNALAIEVVAEGVETAEHADQLRRLGCTFGQGFLWSAARPGAEVTSLLPSRSSPHGHPLFPVSSVTGGAHQDVAGDLGGQ